MDSDFLTTTPLFRGMRPQEVQAVLHCLGARERQYQRGESIYCAGQRVESMGLVLHGSVQVELDDVWGNRSLLAHVAAGQLFAETYACLPDEPLLVNVTACEKTSVLFLNAARMVDRCPTACEYHGRLIDNLLQILARKNLTLSRRSRHTTPKSIRGRLLSYLSEQAQLAGSCRFAIPLDRQQLADHLGVDRSALSNELGKMQREGLLTFRKNQFELKKEPL